MSGSAFAAQGSNSQSGRATVIATGATVQLALGVAQRLASEGVSVEVLDPRTLVPLDREAIVASVRKTGRVLVTHEAPALRSLISH